MKKVILLTIVLSIALLQKMYAQIDTSFKKADKIIGKADTSIGQKSKQLDKAKETINSIQSNISNLIAQKDINAKNIDSLDRAIKSLNKIKIRTQKQNENLLSQNSKLEQAKNLQESILAKLNKQIEIARKQIDTLTKVADTLKSSNKLKDSLLMIKENSLKKADKTLELTSASIANQLDSSETVAIIEMLDNTSIHTSKGIISAKIKKVHINTIQGVILEIIVTTDKGVFRNKGNIGKTNDKNGIVITDLLHFEKSTQKKLYKEMFTTTDPLEEGGETSYLLLKDVIRYTPISSYTDAVYGEFEITLPSVKGDKIYLIKESSSINTYFNIAAFTDIKGIGGEPNGIAQFTADAKFMLNTHPFNRTSIVYANYISFQGGLSKFDSEFKGTEISNQDIINRKDLLQRANYKVGVKLNLIKGYLPPVPILLYNTMELNIGYNVIGSQIFKTGFKDLAQTVIDTAFRTITQNQWYTEPTITFSRRKNFSMCLALPYYLNNVKKSSSIQNSHTEHWVVPGISLMYFGKRDVGSKLFFRYNHYININDKSQAFSQMQLGYSLNLTQVINNK
ncbi:hypothetical protein [Pedobacter terrae]|uniref:hypothetical protein n=1 Tax=Pedobacter terrae TaxID=405671 RepID=UPI002FFBD59C